MAKKREQGEYLDGEISGAKKLPKAEAKKRIEKVERERKAEEA